MLLVIRITRIEGASWIKGPPGVRNSARSGNAHSGMDIIPGPDDHHISRAWPNRTSTDAGIASNTGA
jgi:hypothetical protein